EAMVKVAVETGCDLVHPGYGFLSESASFADACATAGLSFVGPGPEALRLFGDKTRARSVAASVGIPIVPGSAGNVGSAEEATAWAERLGYPVMLKAAAGGGGRGIRMVADRGAMAEAFERCRSEAAAAFGDGALFVERALPRPRHIEVQILADAGGNTVHLYERDCSVQLRNQKVVEVAPAAGLDEGLRVQILADAVRLARAAEYLNAGTFEFLVVPETGEHFFIEGNPRIQVEHTVTEQVTGVDLVEAQLRIASGTPLAALGLGEQAAVLPPRGYAVQARVAATGTGTISAYKEPSGPGVRVDSCGYLGYAPPPQFDPLLAKVICSSPAGAPLSAALDRTRRALDEFHLAGVPTNIDQLRAILSSPEMRDGQARTSWLQDSPQADAPGPASEAVAFLARRAAGHLDAVRTPRSPVTAPVLTDGQQAVECPMASALVEFRVTEGDPVREGDAVLVVSAMKMETVVPAPCSGIVASLQMLEPGAELAAGDILAVIEARQGAGIESRTSGGTDGWDDVLGDIRDLQRLAEERLAPKSDDPGVVRQRSRGKLTCRERISLLLDEGSFREIGSVTGFASYDDEGRVSAFTPANHVGGRGAIGGRPVVVCADD
ncbi:MAG: ATP-grasp domain-containing protein, partial [Acidimicrobiaceae bacterium]|nr:ATP-grasp domain-containing protein [Acidimicrobiaceae bacterium]